MRKRSGALAEYSNQSRVIRRDCAPRVNELKRAAASPENNCHGGPTMRPIRQSILRKLLVGAVSLLSLLVFFSSRGYSDEIPAGWKASNMKAIGYSDL